ncbi:MAG: 1-acyl-sn-glycerol-3-phosphate acyltransferase [Vicinamibacterales bacterium]
MKSQRDIQTWLRTAMAHELHVDPKTLDPSKPFAYYGLDSLTAATLSGDLGDWLERDISPDLLVEHPTIDALSAALAPTGDPASAPAPNPAGPPVPAAANREPAPTVAADADVDIDDRAGPPGRGALWVRSLARVLTRLTSVLDVEGRERLPHAGPALFACNHLHILDALWMSTVLPVETRFLVAGEFRRKPVVGRLLTAAGAIFIDRGRGDRDALDQAVAVLRRGGMVGVAPEGKLSRTGGLIKGHSGIAYLSARSGVPVIPVAAFGQERAGASWLRLSRIKVAVRVGEPVAAPAWPAKARDLELHVDAIMRAIAALLPSAYRGIYRDVAAD